MTPSGEKLPILGVFWTPSGLVLSKNSIAVSLVQAPCSFCWTNPGKNTDCSKPFNQVWLRATV